MGKIKSQLNQSKNKSHKSETENLDIRHHGFAMDKTLGQHVLKNPLVATGIIDKVILTDHRLIYLYLYGNALNRLI